MQLFGRTKQIAVYFIPDIAAAYLVRTGSPPLNESREVLELLDSLMLEHKVTKLISNSEELRIASDESFELISGWLANAAKRGLRAWADLPPRSAVAQLAMRRMGSGAMISGVEFVQLPDFDACKRWVATK